MITATRKHQICCGHRVFGHEGKCKDLHGHNYTFEMTLAAKNGLDEIGRVIDFSMIKFILCKWLEVNWDHKTLFHRDDPLYWSMITRLKDVCNVNALVSLPVNPTAENLAKYFVEDISCGLLLNTDVELIKCVVWETDKCCATYTKEEIKVNAEDTVGAGRRNMGKEK